MFTITIGTPMDGISVTRRFQRILKKAGLPRQRFHGPAARGGESPFRYAMRTVWSLIRAGVLAALALAVWWSAPRLESALRTAQLVLNAAPTTLRIPVAGVSPHALADSWGAPRSGGRRHQGIDIFAPRGTPVYATTPGGICHVGQNRLGGNVIWLLGPGGQMHYYAHLDRFADVRATQIVAAGSTLGFIGTTGNAQGGAPHLHYGIYAPIRGGAINPFPLLAAHAPRT